MKLAFLIINGPDLSWVSGYLQNIRMPSPLSIPVSQPDRPAVVGGGMCVHVCTCVCCVSGSQRLRFHVCKQVLAPRRRM